MTLGTETTVSVIVPWRPQSDRNPGWDWLKGWYRAHHPEWEIIETDCVGDWNKPTAVNNGVAQARGNVLVIADADVIPVPDSLPAAVRAAQATGWVVPHGKVHRLRREPTQRILAQDPAHVGRIPTGPLIRPAYTGMVGGGLFVITKANYLASGGFDPGFIRWGVEDSAFGIAADTLLGKHLRYYHVPLVHLWHDPGQREVNPYYGQNIARKRLYTAAQGDPVMMAQLRGVPVPRPHRQSAQKPKESDSFDAWMLYANKSGIDVPRSLFSQPDTFKKYVASVEVQVVVGSPEPHDDGDES